MTKTERKAIEGSLKKWNKIIENENFSSVGDRCPMCTYAGNHRKSSFSCDACRLHQSGNGCLSKLGKQPVFGGRNVTLWRKIVYAKMSKAKRLELAKQMSDNIAALLEE